MSRHFPPGPVASLALAGVLDSMSGDCARPVASWALLRAAILQQVMVSGPADVVDALLRFADELSDADLGGYLPPGTPRSSSGDAR